MIKRSPILEQVSKSSDWREHKQPWHTWACSMRDSWEIPLGSKIRICVSDKETKGAYQIQECKTLGSNKWRISTKNYFAFMRLIYILEELLYQLTQPKVKASDWLLDSRDIKLWIWVEIE